MNVLELAQEIIDGRRISREDDLSIFLECDLQTVRSMIFFQKRRLWKHAG